MFCNVCVQADCDCIQPLNSESKCALCLSTDVSHDQICDECLSQVIEPRFTDAQQVIEPRSDAQRWIEQCALAYPEAIRAYFRDDTSEIPIQRSNVALFPVEPNTSESDNDVTCVVCNSRRRCELLLLAYGNGRRVWCGLHQACLDRHKERCGIVRDNG